MNQDIINSVNQIFINYQDQMDTDTISYLSGLIHESESVEELREQIELVIKDFNLEIASSDEQSELIENLIHLLKKRGLIEFQIESKPKSHLVCLVDPNAEPDLNDPNLTFEQYLGLTRSKDAATRLRVLRTMCPCKVKSDIDQLWTRIMEMASDTDPKVRYQVMHNLCDGSPLWREDAVIQTLEKMHNDEDAKIRRRIHNILTHYKHTGKWNIM